MRLILLLYLSTIIPLCLLSQKHDYHWHNSINFSMTFSDSGLVFTPIHPTLHMSDLSFGISDKAGNFLFYTNGNYIANAQHDIIEGGDTLNIGALWGQNIQSPNDKSSYVPYTYLALPDPEEDSVFYFFCQFIDSYITTQPYYWLSHNIRVSKIDMRAKQGRGRVVYRNKVIYDTPHGMGITAIRHGNGRDWWLLTSSEDRREHHHLLLHKDSLLEVVVQDASHGSYTPLSYWDKQWAIVIVPSQDGNHFIDNYGYSVYRYYSFDRCTGTSKNVNIFTPPEDTSFWSPTKQSRIFLTTFSPNGRYVYGSSYRGIYQFDVTQEDILASGVRIDSNYHWVSFGNVISGSSQPRYRLGPDGRIYAIDQSTHNVIRYPDLPGQAADHCHAAYKEPPHSCIGNIYYTGYTPFYPNYRLGALEGSPCDTLRIKDPPEEDTTAFRIHIWPNPGNGFIQVEITLPEYQHSDTRLRLYDLLGREVYFHQWVPYAYLHTIDATALPAGTYLLQLEHRGRRVAIERLVIVQ